MSHRPSRPYRRGVCAVFAVLLAVVAPACDDERGSISDPDQPPAGPDSDFIFATTLFSTSVFRFQNTAMDTLRRVVSSGQDLPVQFPAATNASGFMRVNDAGTNLYRIDLSNYNDPVVSPLFEAINGVMIVLMEEADPGLNFTINPGDDQFLPLGPGPHPVVYSLPTDFGDGAIVTVTGTVHGELIEDAVRHSGFVHETGTVRMEEPTQRFLFVLRLGVEYEYDPDILPSFAEWPVGSYEIGIFSAGTTLTPFLVTFNGDGRAFYPYRGTTCNVNLDVPFTDITAGNPCSGL